MVYNILDGGVGRIDPIAEVIRQVNPDCVLVPEACAEGERAEFEKLARRLGMDYFLAQSPWQADGSVGLLSKVEIAEATNLGAIDARFTRSAVRAVLRDGAREFGIVGVHLHARERLADEAVRMNEVPAVLAAAADFRARGLAHVLAGDFNATSPVQIVDLAKLRPKSRERARENGDLIPRQAIGAILAGGYVDTHVMGRTPEELQCSFTTSHPALRVDYVFVPAGMAGGVRRSEVVEHVLARYVSDHYPVVCEIGLT